MNLMHDLSTFAPDHSIFEINNPYPEKKVLNKDCDYLVFDDFLKKPDEYKEVLRQFPVFPSDFFYDTSSPGWRQIIPFEFFTNIENVLGNYTGSDTWVQQSFTNIYRSGMPCNCKSWYPHQDSMNYALNLWLCDGPGGTAFHTWRGRYHGLGLPEETQGRIFNKQVKGNFEYEEFRGDDEWEMYHLEPVKYNRAIFYNGNNFHSAFIPEGSYQNHSNDFWDQSHWRYSLVLMGGVDKTK